MPNSLDFDEDAIALATPEKRRRGRPRKSEVAATAAPAAAPEIVSDAPRRGRPRKSATSDAPAATATPVSSDVEETKVIRLTKAADGEAAPKKRGHPRREDSLTPISLSAPAKRGRKKAVAEDEILDDDDEDFNIPENFELHPDLLHDHDDDTDYTPEEDEDDFEEEVPQRKTRGRKRSTASSSDDLEEEYDEVGFDELEDILSESLPTNENLTEVVTEKVIIPYEERDVIRVETVINDSDYEITRRSLEPLGIEPYIQQSPDEIYMNDAQRAHIRRILEKQRSDLLTQLHATRELMREEANNYADDIDKASQESDFAIDLRNRDRERRLIQKIDRALTRIETDLDFGYCDSCGDEIGLRRLEVRPTAELCVNCKAKAEIHEKQQRG